MFQSIKKSFTSRKFKNGAYSTILTAVVIVILLFLNLFVEKLDLSVDLSNDGKYTLTKESKDLVKKLKNDITIYYIVQDGQEDAYVEKIIDKYKSISSSIKVIKKDPVVYPAFTKQYTEEAVSDNSVIVLNNTTKAHRYIPSSDLFVQEIDYNTGQSYISGIDVEGQITSALQYVTNEKLPKIYMVEGHGELPLGDTINKGIKKLNIEMESLQTLTAESIPKDCNILLINGPTKDLSENEVEMIKKYLASGGKAIMFSAYTTEAMENYSSLFDYYGIVLQNGIVLEAPGYYANDNPSYLVPSIENHEITSSIVNAGRSVVLPSAKGFKMKENMRSSVSMESLITTSSDSYSKVNVESETIEKEDGDIKGPFQLGVAVTETIDQIETKLAFFSSVYAMDEGIVSTGQVDNAALLYNSISWMENMESGLSIPVRNLDQNYLTVSPSEINFWSALLVVILPALILGGGLFIWLRRRKS